MKVALIGAGYIAQHHLAALKKLPQIEVAAICDHHLGRAEVLAKQTKNAKPYASLDSMLDAEKLDAAHILLPPDHHISVTEKVMQAGLYAFIEKPMGVSTAECQNILSYEQLNHCRAAINHNFLFYPTYLKLKEAINSRQLGRLDHLTITWQRELEPLRNGPYNLWMLKEPKNLWLELGSHLVSMLLDLAGEPDYLHAVASDPVSLPTGENVYRRWVVMGTVGKLAFEMRLSVAPGFEQRSLELRGQAGAAVVDFERDTFLLKRHLPYSQPFDLYHMNKREALSLLKQGHDFIMTYVKSKAKIKPFGDPYAASIAASINQFYASLNGSPDPRQSVMRGIKVISLCERIQSVVPTRENQKQEQVIKSVKPTVLVLGASGFIGFVLTKKLLEQGHAVRILARDPVKLLALCETGDLEIVKGDMQDIAKLRTCLQGIETVFHLARAHATTWKEYQDRDIAATQELARLCLELGIRKLIYTGTIDSYYAGEKGSVITEETPLDPQIQKRNLYAQAKAESEKLLMQMHKEEKLPVTIVRPGIVIGEGGSPFHWGVGMWRQATTCQLWGKGENPLPFVLVDDVADGLLLCLQNKNLEGQSFNLIDTPCITAKEYIVALEDALHAAIDVYPTAVWRFAFQDYFKWLVKKAVRHHDRRSPSWRDWQSRTQLAFFDCSKARSVLGWKATNNKEQIIENGIHKPALGWWA